MFAPVHRLFGEGLAPRIDHRYVRSYTTQVLQVLADVFQAAVFTAAASDSAAIGAALRAKHGMECRRRGNSYVPFVEVFGSVLAPGHEMGARVQDLLLTTAGTGMWCLFSGFSCRCRVILSRK